jgi:transposase
MAHATSTPTEPVFVAIDVAKMRNDVLIEIPGQKRRQRLVVRNVREDHDRLIETLTALGQPVVAGFEATGNYHRPLAWRLLQAGFEARLISSVAMARTREAIHNGWDKNDPKDAQVILHMLRTGLSQYYNDPLAAGLSDIQELSKTHEAVSRAKTETLHRVLTHYLPLYFPEIERFRQNSRSDWFFAFLEMFPTPAAITVLSKQAFSEAAWKVLGRKVAKARLIGDIYETARESIALPVTREMPNSRHSGAIFSPSRSRAMNLRRSSIGLHSFQGIQGPPQMRQSVNHVIRMNCQLCPDKDSRSAAKVVPRPTKKIRCNAQISAPRG